MEYLLYRKMHHPGEVSDPDMYWFSPSPLGLFLPGEKEDRRVALSRLYFWLITGGRATICCCRSPEGEILHTSVVVPKCYKFPFLGKGDYEIGPCCTVPEARRQGLYFRTLQAVTSASQYRDSSFYMLVAPQNTASVCGIEKAGFLYCGKVRKTSLLKRYCRIEKGNR